jgi:hypothetical protein
MRSTRSAVAMLATSLLLCIAPSGARTQEPGADGSDPDAAPTFSVDGFSTWRYVYRRAEAGGELAGNSAQDRDTFLALRLDVTMPREQRYEAHLHAAARRDLDGGSDAAEYAPFEDSGDSWASSWSAQVYEAHFDVNYLYRSLAQLRLGRQAGQRDEPIFFDGIAADLDLSKRFRATAYGGYAVHFFELQQETTDDPLAGAGVDYLPHPATEVSLDYLATRDLRAPDARRDDRLTSLRVRQHFSPHWRGLLKARALNGETRDARLRVLGQVPAAELTLSASYYRQLATLNELTTEEDPYSDVIGQSLPYHTLDCNLRWQPAASYALDLGYYGRRLLDDADQGPFNREFSRSYLAVDADALLVAGLSITASGERWQSLDTDTRTAGIDLAYRAGSGRRVARYSAGSAYQLFVYDHYLQLGERTGVRTHYLRARLPVGASFLISGDYERETGLDTYDTLKIGARYDF